MSLRTVARESRRGAGRGVEEIGPRGDSMSGRRRACRRCRASGRGGRRRGRCRPASRGPATGRRRVDRACDRPRSSDARASADRPLRRSRSPRSPRTRAWYWRFLDHPIVLGDGPLEQFQRAAKGRKHGLRFEAGGEEEVGPLVEGERQVRPELGIGRAARRRAASRNAIAAKAGGSASVEEPPSRCRMPRAWRSCRRVSSDASRPADGRRPSPSGGRSLPTIGRLGDRGLAQVAGLDPPLEMIRGEFGADSPHRGDRPRRGSRRPRRRASARPGLRASRAGLHREDAGQVRVNEDEHAGVFDRGRIVGDQPARAHRDRPAIRVHGEVPLPREEMPPQQNLWVRFGSGR